MQEKNQVPTPQALNNCALQFPTGHDAEGNACCSWRRTGTKTNPPPCKCLHITLHSQAEHRPSKTSQSQNLLFFPDHRECVSVSIKCDQLHNQVQVVPFTVRDNYVYLQQETISVCMWIAVDVSLTLFYTEKPIDQKNLETLAFYIENLLIKKTISQYCPTGSILFLSMVNH